MIDEDFEEIVRRKVINDSAPSPMVHTTVIRTIIIVETACLQAGM
jgi:hypothetical protein